jgi:hypothetical protein
MHQQIVTEYFRVAGGFEPAVGRRCTPAAHRGDPLYGVWARVAARP